ncbi:Exosome complex component rrp42 [Exserohilum turcicum]
MPRYCCCCCCCHHSFSLPSSCRNTTMAPHHALVNLSPAELSFLRASLAQTPPVRLDVTKGPRDFRSMRAEYDVLPTANGSARIALEDGTEALVGVKAEVEKTRQQPMAGEQPGADVQMGDGDGDGDGGEQADGAKGKGQNAWLDMSVEIPGFRDDDALPVFLASMLTESLLASGELKDRLYINTRFHWKLYIDVRSAIRIHPCALLTPLDPPALAAPLVPPRPALHDDAPGPPDNTPPSAQVGKRRRPALRRRLGRGRAAVPQANGRKQDCAPAGKAPRHHTGHGCRRKRHI